MIKRPCMHGSEELQFLCQDCSLVVLPSSIQSGKLDWPNYTRTGRLCTCSLLSTMLHHFSRVDHCCCGWLWCLPNSAYSMMQHAWGLVSYKLRRVGIWVFVGSDFLCSWLFPRRALWPKLCGAVLWCACLSCTSYVQLLLKTLTVLCDHSEHSVPALTCGFCGCIW